MPDDGATSSPQTDMEFAQRGGRENGLDRRRLYASIVRMLESRVDMDNVLAYIEALRRDGGVEDCRKLDRYLLQEIAGFETAKSELESVFRDMQQKLEALLSPPFFPARYVGSVIMGSETYAMVAHDGSQRIVAFGSELKADDLDAGDQVYLSHERNTLAGKAPRRPQLSVETAVMLRTTDDGRLVLSDRDVEVVVETGRELASEKLREGDQVLWDRSACMALNRLEPGAAEGYEDIDDSAEQRLGGIDRQRDAVLSSFASVVSYPDIARQYGLLGGGARRLLLKGPPGTGKTTLMRIIAARIARESRQACRIVTIAGAELYSSYVGETERNIRRCFAAFKDYDGPGLVFFDEIDAIGRVRGHASGYHDDRFLGTLLTELEGMHSSNVAVVASTNRADMLDAALRSRFSWEIELPRPGMAAARQICSIHLPESLPYRPNGAQAPGTREALIEAGIGRLYEPNSNNLIASLQFRDGTRREVAARELISGRLIEQMCRAAREAAFVRQCGGGEPGLVVEDMETAAADVIERLRDTLTRHNARSYDMPDIDQDLDVVSVEAQRPRIDAARYAR